MSFGRNTDEKRGSYRAGGSSCDAMWALVIDIGLASYCFDTRSLCEE
jgi:hypothetical protein